MHSQMDNKLNLRCVNKRNSIAAVTISAIDEIFHANISCPIVPSRFLKANTKLVLTYCHMWWEEQVVIRLTVLLKCTHKKAKLC